MSIVIKNSPKPSDSLFAVEMNEKRAAKQDTRRKNFVSLSSIFDYIPKWMYKWNYC